MTVLYWLRRDLRVTDNPALTAALADGRPVVPVFILDDADAGEWKMGGASRWWLHGSLEALARDLAAKGSRLILRSGPAKTELDRLIADTKAEAVYWNRRYEPWAVRRDEGIKAGLAGRGIQARSFNAALLAEPWTVTTQKGQPFRVFTPFWRALRTGLSPELQAPPAAMPAVAADVSSEDLADWALRPTRPDWAGGLAAMWSPGEGGAGDRLEQFLENGLLEYDRRRDLPGVDGTSRLSPHLHFGEVGPRQVWRGATAQSLAVQGAEMPKATETFLSEIAWREFSYHLLHQAPHLPKAAFRPEFDAFPWAADEGGLEAWQRGRTGYPIVDAGMRQLWATGWMHNRVRMVVASFLIKHLLLDWRAGEAWFWDTLVDADLASNAASWQWVAGSGADAAPYFRIFNPTAQGERFDPKGDYVRRWVPELARLPDRFVHAPWTARPIDLADAGVDLGRTYPRPIVDHGFARGRALAAFKSMGEDA